MNDRIEIISLDAIEPHPANRKIGGFDPEKLEQLAESIRAVGVQQPAIVRISPNDLGSDVECLPRYQLVAGERRWRAALLAGLDALPCIVRELDDVTALKIRAIENLQRDDVHPLDEADGYARLIDEAGYTVEQLASEVGKSVSYVYQRMKLKSLVPEVRKLFVDGTITAGHAILIARLTAEQQKRLAAEQARIERVENVLETSTGALPLEALRQCVLRYWGEIGYAQRAFVGELERWVEKGEQKDVHEDGNKRIGKMNEFALNRFLLRLAMAREVRFSQYETPRTKTIDALEKVFRIGKPAKAAKK